MGKYTSDDNRSMQLNDNNDRYWSSRDIDPYDDGGCDEEDTNLYKRVVIGYRSTIPKFGQWEYNRMEYLYPIWNDAEHAGTPYESYKDVKNEYRRLKRWLNKNTHDLHEQLYWEY